MERIIIDYLKHHNNNIDWKDFCYKNIINDDITTQTLQKIRQLTWIERKPGETCENNNFEDNFKYVIKNILQTKITDKQVIGILYFSNYNETSKSLPKYYYRDYKSIVDYYVYALQCLGINYIKSNNIDELNSCDYINIYLLQFLNNDDVSKIDVKKIIKPILHFYDTIECYTDDSNKRNYIENVKKMYNKIHIIDNYIVHNDLNVYQYKYILV